MSPEQALQVLIQMAALASAPKAAHVQAEQAAMILKGIIEKGKS